MSDKGTGLISLTGNQIEEQFQRMAQTNPFVYRAMVLERSGAVTTEAAFKTAIVHLALINDELTKRLTNAMMGSPVRATSKEG